MIRLNPGKAYTRATRTRTRARTPTRTPTNGKVSLSLFKLRHNLPFSFCCRTPGQMYVTPVTATSPRRSIVTMSKNASVGDEDDNSRSPVWPVVAFANGADKTSDVNNPTQFERDMAFPLKSPFP